MVSKSDLQQEAYCKIDSLSEDEVRLIINLIDKMKPSAATNDEGRKKGILNMAGKYDFDEEAISSLRKESMIWEF